MDGALHRASAFGLRWRSDVALPGFDPDAAGERPGIDPVRIDVVRIERLPERPGGQPVNRGVVYPDGVRLAWEDAVAFDMTGGTRVAYAPGPGWTGAMPASFYGTVAALTAAWRGLIPLHACAVEVDGRAVLVAGAGGAGKSTLTAGLIAQGARFVADDLTAVSVGVGGIGVPRGRPTLRLHPDTAARIATDDAHAVPGDPRGKWLVRPQRRSRADVLPLGAVLLLCQDAAVAARAPAIDLFAHLFRPRWVDALPMRAALMADLLAVAARTPLLRYPAQPDFTAASWRHRAAEAMALLGAKLRAPAQHDPAG